MFEWLRKLRRPDWVISIPDGYAATASVSYKGRALTGVSSLTLELAAGSDAILHLQIHPLYLSAVLEVLNLQIDTGENEYGH